MNPLTKAGAELIAAKVAAYWRGLGYEYIETAVVNLGFVDGKYRYGVRSNLLNGLPPRQSRQIYYPHGELERINSQLDMLTA